MRTLLIAALSLSALTPSHDAEACGSYVPELRVMRLSTHFTPGTRRSFVLYGPAASDAKLEWTDLAPRTYDGTQIAAGSTLSQPVTFTLVGRSGSRVVKGNKHVFLSRSWRFDAAMHAIEVDAPEGFSIAIEGEHEAAWVALEEVAQTGKAKARTTAWLKAQGITPHGETAIYVHRIAGTSFETVSLYPKGSIKLVTFVKYEQRNLGRHDGSPMGAFTTGLERRLVLADGANATTVKLGVYGL